MKREKLPEKGRMEPLQNGDEVRLCSMTVRPWKIRKNNPSFRGYAPLRRPLNGAEIKANSADYTSGASGCRTVEARGPSIYS